MVFLIFFLLLLGLILEGSVTILPFVVINLLLLVIFGYGKQALFAAFAAGLFLDVFLLRSVGLSDVFFVTFVFVIILYQRKFEINSYQFVLFSSFFGSLTYLYLFHAQNVFLFAIVSSIIAILLYGLLKKINILFRVHKNLNYNL